MTDTQTIRMTDDPPDRAVDNASEPEKLVNLSNQSQVPPPSPTVTKPSSTLSKWDSRLSLISTPMELHPRIHSWLAEHPSPRLVSNPGPGTTPVRPRPRPIREPRTAGPDPRVRTAKLLGPVPAPLSEGHPPSPPIIVSSPVGSLHGHNSLQPENHHRTSEVPLKTGTTSRTSISDDTVRRTNDDNEPTKDDHVIVHQQTSSPLSSLPSSLEKALTRSPTMLAARRSDNPEIREETIVKVEDEAAASSVAGTPAREAPIRGTVPVPCPSNLQPMVPNPPETSSPASSILDGRWSYDPLPEATLIEDAMRLLVAQNEVPDLYIIRMRRVRDAIGRELWNEWSRAQAVPADGTLWQYEAADWQQLLFRFGTSYADWFKSVVITEVASVVTTDPVVTTGSQPVAAFSDPGVKREQVSVVITDPVGITSSTSATVSSSGKSSRVDGSIMPVEDLSLVHYSVPFQTDLSPASSHFPGEYPHTDTEASPSPTGRRPHEPLSYPPLTPWSQRLLDTLVPPLARRLFSPTRPAAEAPSAGEGSVKSEETEEVHRPGFGKLPEMQQTPGWQDRLSNLFSQELRDVSSEPEGQRTPWKDTSFSFDDSRWDLPAPARFTYRGGQPSEEQASLFEDYDLPNPAIVSDGPDPSESYSSSPLKHLQSLPPLSTPFFTRAFIVTTISGLASPQNDIHDLENVFQNPPISSNKRQTTASAPSEPHTVYRHFRFEKQSVSKRLFLQRRESVAIGCVAWSNLTTCMTWSEMQALPVVIEQTSSKPFWCRLEARN
ncbi:hypothetical protein BJ508DRAFT_349819 [Ascobolus immersus RN42]|uniref:Uncharacterized protein n=1 Tax=Ascobolus immersus RN42 TaxID=1160509 RepID=A0A3N4HYI2_ASCIM|nr:hypothetical protein BJ508DRAFT_349819 [Ascobolus immersus RN42]